MKGKSGEILQRQLSEQPTRLGDLYWRLGTTKIEPARGLPIWSSEVEWLIEALDDLSKSPIAGAIKRDGQYPVAFRPTGMHALALIISRTPESTELWIERWAAAHKKGASASTTYSAYWYCNKPYLPFSRLVVALPNDWKGLLSKFATSWRADLRSENLRAWSELVSASPDLPRLFPSHDQLIVTVPAEKGDRKIPYYPFCPRPRMASVLAKPFRRLMLEACSTPRSVDEVASLVGMADGAARNALSWTSRYDDCTLKEAAFLTPLRVNGHDEFIATLRLPSLLADPLLTGLAPVTTALPIAGNYGPSPQRAAGLPITDLRAKKLIDERILSTVEGDFPLPTSKEVANTRAAAKPSPRLKQESWLLLQWLDIESRCQSNHWPADPIRRVLAWQRLALLRFDCAVLFGDDPDNDDVSKILEDAAARHSASLAGNSQTAHLVRSKDLPR